MMELKEVKADLSLTEKKCLPKRIVNTEKEEWRKDLDSMQKRWSAIFKTNLEQFPHDITFSVAGENITCHKFVLSVASPFFEVIIKQAEKLGENVIELPNTDATAFRALLHKIYKCDIKKVAEDPCSRIFWGENKCWGNVLNDQEGRSPPDVSFLIGEQKEIFSCHQFILSVSSPVFEGLFGDNTIFCKETKQIELCNVNPIGFRNLIKYVYQDENAAITDEDLGPTLSAAHQFKIPELQKQCSERLRQILSVKNAVTILQTSDSVADVELNKAAHEFLMQNFEDVLDCDDFLNFTSGNMVEYLKSDDLYVFSEINIFKGVIRWAENQCRQEQKEVTKENLRFGVKTLLEHIRLPTLSFDDYMSTVYPSGILSNEDIIQLFEYFVKRIRNVNQDTKDLRFVTKVRNCRSTDITVNLVSNFTPSSAYEWDSSPNFYRHSFKTVGGCTPLYLKGVGFAGRTTHPSESMVVCLKVTPDSNLQDILSQEVLQFQHTAQPNSVHMIELSKSVKIVPEMVYRVSFCNKTGGFASWSTPIPEVELFKNPHNNTKTIKMVRVAGNILYCLKFSHSE